MKYVYKSFYCDSNKNLYVLSIRRRDTVIMSSVHSAPKYYIQICPFSLLYFILFFEQKHTQFARKLCLYQSQITLYPLSQGRNLNAFLQLIEF